MARSGMTAPIQILREMCELGTADYTVGTATYWSDDHVQDALDRHSSRIRVQLSYMTEYTGGSVQYRDFKWHDTEVEHAESGTAVWRVVDSTGAIIGTANYTVNYPARSIRFDSSQDAVLYLETREFEMNSAAAEVWGKKAAHYARDFDVRTDNHNVKRSQKIQHALQMKAFYSALRPARVLKVRRTDTN